MMQPANSSADLRRMLSDASLISSAYDKEEEVTLVGRGSPTYSIPRRPNPLRSNAVYPLETLAVKAPEPAQVAPPSATPSRKPSISAFPTRQPEGPQAVTLLPATTYTPAPAKNRFDFSTLKPPPSMKNLAIGRHRRDSSMASSATVQMVLRLSNVEDMPPLNTQAIEAARKGSLSAASDSEETKEEPKRPSPLASVEVADDEDMSDEEGSPTRDPVRDVRMKTLPPVPNRQTIRSETSHYSGDDEQEQGEEEKPDGPTLSPTVYEPPTPVKTKLPSPRGVGFTTPASRSHGSSVRSPPPRQNSGGSPRAVLPNTKPGDWI